MMGGRSEFDSAIRLAGGKLVIAKTVEDLQPALTSQTAMVYTTWRDERVERVLKITKAAGVPFCWMTQVVFRPSITLPLRENGHRPVLFQRRKRFVRPTMRWCIAGTKRPDRRRHGQ